MPNWGTYKKCATVGCNYAAVKKSVDKQCICQRCFDKETALSVFQQLEKRMRSWPGKILQQQEEKSCAKRSVLQ